MDQETFGDQFKSCNVEFTAKAGSGSVKMVPVSLGVNASVGVGIVIGRAGVQDLYLTGKVEVEAGTNALGELAKDKDITTSMGGIGVSDKSQDAGVKGRMSLISGKTTLEGTGLFK
ncbi:MAG: hypothetical protein GZ094_11935 [Mariniphaga sp.]|nr:hypothetical protein [Mariniphaga sp.]